MVQVPTRYTDNPNNLNSVIDLKFLQPNLDKFDNHVIYPKWRLLLDHASLIVKISNFAENIQTRKYTIIKNSEEEINFVAEVIESIKKLNTNHINNKKNFECIV